MKTTDSKNQKISTATAKRPKKPSNGEKTAVEQSLLALVVQHMDDAGDPESNQEHHNVVLPPSASGTLEPTGDECAPELDQMMMRLGGNGF